MSVSRLRPAAVLLLALHVGGCTTWQPVQVSPREFIESESPYKIRFRDYTGAWLDVTYPRVDGDAITGTAIGRRPSDGRMGPTSIRRALADVMRIEAQLVNTPQTVIAVTAVGSLLAFAILCAAGVACGKAQSPVYD